MTPTGRLDTAIAAISDATMSVRDDSGQLDPADIAGVIAAVRELFWRADTLTAVIAAAYSHQHSLGHDRNLDPATAVTEIAGQLRVARQHLAAIDVAFSLAHNNAAHLHHTP
jgi:hypothetical protein